MNVYLHHIETKTPPFSYGQELIAEKLSSWMGEPALARRVKAIFRRSGIEKRYSALPDFSDERSGQLFTRGRDGKIRQPGTAERNDFFVAASKDLLESVARGALEKCPTFSARDITHVITVSCTGFYNPGPDIELITRLGLRPDTERFHLGFMGCYAAFPAIRMARQFCLADPSAVVLVVCLELCSLHMQLKGDSDSLLANALFGDGAAAALVSARRPSPERSCFSLGQFLSALAPEGEKDMAWTIGGSGFDLSLSSYVPGIIGLNVPDVIEDLLERAGIGRSMFDLWAVHPGGRAILDRVEAALKLRPEQMTSSRRVLREYGNMSSATVLFVLADLLRMPSRVPRDVCAMAFGPGLTIETAALGLVPRQVSRSDHSPKDVAQPLLAA